MRQFALAAVLTLLAAPLPLAPGDEPDPELAGLLDRIEAAMKARRYAEVLKLARQAADRDPKNPAVPFAAGTAHAALRQHEEAVRAFSRVLELEPKAAAARDRRGDAYLKLGRFAEALADFDAFLEANPKFAPDHWRRGIALYYAGRYRDGVAQFELHRTVNPQDVENAVWHYLCNARVRGRPQARQQLIPVTDDPRVPMKQIWELFAGKLRPQDVLDAAEQPKLDGEARTEARFYAHLYVALFYESEDDPARCREHLTIAVEKYPIGHYMWDVAAVHLKRLRESDKK